MDPFRPHAPNGTQTISVTASNVATALTFPGRTQYVLTTPSSNTAIVFIDFGTSGTVATTTTSYPLLPGMKEVISVWGAGTGANPTHIACIGASTGQTLYVTGGSGE